MIFVQIASYRDSELLPTIIDCYAKAKYKSDLTIGVCLQTVPEDRSLEGLSAIRNLRVDKMSWQESQGLGWARSRAQALYDGEDYTLQLHSHHRFALHWDEALLKALELAGSRKPALSSYASAYDPLTGRKLDWTPCVMAPAGFAESGNLLLRPSPIEDAQNLSRPVPARFAAGHFLFTLGSHCQECPYDPALYFGGDEISLSIRSFTRGYDLFHPHMTVLWHEYVRERKPKHWGDHTVEKLPAGAAPWQERERVSRRRLRSLLVNDAEGEDLGDYGLGDVRSHADYLEYAGVNFADRLAQSDEEWRAGFTSRSGEPGAVTAGVS